MQNIFNFLESTLNSFYLWLLSTPSTNVLVIIATSFLTAWAGAAAGARSGAKKAGELANEKLEKEQLIKEIKDTEHASILAAHSCIEACSYYEGYKDFYQKYSDMRKMLALLSNHHSKMLVWKRNPIALNEMYHSRLFIDELINSIHNISISYSEKCDIYTLLSIYQAFQLTEKLFNDSLNDHKKNRSNPDAINILFGLKCSDGSIDANIQSASDILDENLSKLIDLLYIIHHRLFIHQKELLIEYKDRYKTQYQTEFYSINFSSQIEKGLISNDAINEVQRLMNEHTQEKR